MIVLKFILRNLSWRDNLKNILPWKLPAVWYSREFMGTMDKSPDVYD